MSFQKFPHMLVKQFEADKVKPSRITNLFNTKQENEPLKNYLNCYCDISIRIHQPDEKMFMESFIKSLQANPFSESLI